MDTPGAQESQPTPSQIATPGPLAASRKIPHLVIVIVLLFLLVVSGVAIILTQTKSDLTGPDEGNFTFAIRDTVTADPTMEFSSGHTYTDRKNNFSIAFPEKLEPSTSTAALTDTVSFTYVGPTQQASGRTQSELSDGYKVVIDIKPLEGLSDVLEVAKRSRQGILGTGYGDNCSVSAVSPTLVDKVQAAQYMATNCFGDSVSYFVIYNNRSYQISGLYAGDAHLVTVNRILSTFKFLEPDTLLEVKALGGLCPEGTCGTTSVVKGDGSVYRDNQLLKKAQPADMTKLKALMESTDFLALTSTPFTGTCPIAYDGQEHTYTFYTKSGTQTFSDCKVQVDKNSELMVHVQSLLGE